MRIALLDNRQANLVGQAATYVAELGPQLATDHRVTILTIEPGLRHLLHELRRVRRMVAADQPEVVHVNNLSGLALAAVVWALDHQPVKGSQPIALGIHDDRLLRHRVAFNRRLTGAAGLVVSPSGVLLDRHLAHGFFAGAIQVVIPYGMPYHAEQLANGYRRLLINRRTGRLGDRAA